MPDKSGNFFNGIGLVDLEKILTTELEHLKYPGKNWVPKKEGITDIVIVGGGMCGMVVWHSLVSGGIQNVRILDKSTKGNEGPWVNYARMETLRSPKDLTGPAFGHGALTFQSWYRAQYGEDSWNSLDKILRPMWMDYLKWYRSVLKIPIENGLSLNQVKPVEGNILKLKISGNNGNNNETIFCRKLIFATGRDGIGCPNIPNFVDSLPKKFWAHSSDDIDFNTLAKKNVAVIGVGASAVDNAAEALEHGAAEVRHIIRRKKMPRINKMMGIGSFGFTTGFPNLPDEWRWRFMQYSFSTQTPPPRGSTLRVSKNKNAFFHFGKEPTHLQVEEEKVKIFFADGSTYLSDFIILGTGFKTDPLARTEFGEAAGNILLWEDVYDPPEDEKNHDLKKFPYLNKDFSFKEKVKGTDIWLQNVYCFNYAASASLGKVSGDIPGISDGATWLARSIGATLYKEDIEKHWQHLLDYKSPELLGDEWEPSELEGENNKGKVA